MFYVLSLSLSVSPSPPSLKIQIEILISSSDQPFHLSFSCFSNKKKTFSGNFQFWFQPLDHFFLLSKKLKYRLAIFPIFIDQQQFIEVDSQDFFVKQAPYQNLPIWFFLVRYFYVRFSSKRLKINFFWMMSQELESRWIL